MRSRAAAGSGTRSWKTRSCAFSGRSRHLQLAAGAELGAHLDDVGVDVLVAHRARDRHAVVAVLDEVAGRRSGRRRSAASPRRACAPRRSAPSARACWGRGGRSGRSRRGGDPRCRRSSRAGSPARRSRCGWSRRAPPTTSSNGSMCETSSASKRIREASRERARRRRSRSKAIFASSRGWPVLISSTSGAGIHSPCASRRSSTKDAISSSDSSAAVCGSSIAAW